MVKRCKNLIALVLVLALAGLILAGCGGGNKQQVTGQQAGDSSQEQKLTPVKITMTTWSGYGPLFLARDKGFFKKHGLDVQLIVIQGLGERKQALAGNQVDGIATTLDIETQIVAAGIPLKQIWALDDSYGGDGILAKPEIKTIKDLKGKNVAYDFGTASHILLLSILAKNGMTEQDINHVQMSASDAGSTFVAGKVDAAVTWEPWLSKAVKENKGNLLATSKETPGLIMDTVALRSDWADKHPEALQAMVDALAEAMQYWESNKADANAIMAKGLGIKVEEFTSNLETLRLFNLAQNKEMFGTADKPGTLYTSLQQAIDFGFNNKVIKSKPDAKAMIDPTFVNKAQL
ncbi:ABC transporter substrate-binding protein [Moorella sp. Hama-1]|uniref:ABC transporter substrate-binding protein n=1 Tax=Moorella sp. Hama-1 TaxID=2138101 RepID=UPI000D6419B2|nr:ABC transporter substrate-binding protein [Moorella sp. Hama-1]MDN5360962.1 NitT/TauT family transport system substrate-binding protein [Moorella sp. (in: firmicutes)]BCV20277.1 aliphatic sulfonate ABC transporter substrate-binding protein [Moorella sp. Hama-1]